LFNFFLIFSCSKSDVNPQNSKVVDINKKGTSSPLVQECPGGQHWNYSAGKCVADDCSPGYIWNNGNPGACVFQEIEIITNPNNSNDYVGSDHNSALNSIMPNYNDGNLEPTQQNVWTYTNIYCKSIGIDTSGTDSALTEDVDLGVYNFSNGGCPSLDSVGIILYNKEVISSTTKNYINRLGLLIDSIQFMATSDTIYGDFADEVISFENEIQNDNSITNKEKTMLLAAHAVARYSCNYWFNFVNVKKSTGWFSWKTLLGEDVSGAIGGAVGAAVTGVGLVAVGGAAVAGGVASSVTNAGSQIFHHIFSENYLPTGKILIETKNFYLSNYQM